MYVLEQASHPVILGMEYLKSAGIVLDLSNGNAFSGIKHTTKIVCTSSCTILPNSECMLPGKLAKDIVVGMQGVCTGHNELLNKGLLLSNA